MSSEREVSAGDVILVDASWCERVNGVEACEDTSHRVTPSTTSYHITSTLVRLLTLPSSQSFRLISDSLTGRRRFGKAAVKVCHAIRVRSPLPWRGPARRHAGHRASRHAACVGPHAIVRRVRDIGGLGLWRRADGGLPRCGTLRRAEQRRAFPLGEEAAEDVEAPGAAARLLPGAGSDESVSVAWARDGVGFVTIRPSQPSQAQEAAISLACPLSLLNVVTYVTHGITRCLLALLEGIGVVAFHLERLLVRRARRGSRVCWAARGEGGGCRGGGVDDRWEMATEAERPKVSTRGCADERRMMRDAGSEQAAQKMM